MLHETGNGHAQTSPLVFSTIQTMWHRYREWSADHFEYVIIDESHHVVAPTYREVVSHFAPVFRLGLTATPRRMDQQDILPSFDNHIAYSLPIEKAIVLDYLASINYRVFTDILVADPTETSRSAFSLFDLDRRLFRPRDFGDIAGIFRSAFQNLDRPRAILFCPTIASANELQGELPEVTVVTSRTPRDRRNTAISAFRSGRIEALATVDLFNEGIDIPEANLLVFLRSTDSETVFLQQLGRGLRKTQTKDEVLILDFVAYLERLLYLEKFKNSIETYKREGTAETAAVRSRPGRNEITFDRTALSLIDEIERHRFSPEQVEALEVSFGVDEVAREIGIPVYRLVEMGQAGVLRADVSIAVFPGTSYPYYLRSRLDEIRSLADRWETQARLFPTEFPQLEGDAAQAFLRQLTTVEYSPELKKFYAKGKDIVREIRTDTHHAN